MADIIHLGDRQTSGGGGPQDPTLERRVDRLEDCVRRIDDKLDRIDNRLSALADQTRRIEGKLDSMPEGSLLWRMEGKLDAMPDANQIWRMVVGTWIAGAGIVLLASQLIGL